MILKIHEVRTRLSKLGCFKEVGVFIDTYEGPDALDDGIEVNSPFFYFSLLYHTRLRQALKLILLHAVLFFQGFLSLPRL